MLSLYDLWLVRFDLVLEVMPCRIFAKFDIVPKAQLSPKHLKRAVCNTGIGFYKW